MVQSVQSEPEQWCNFAGNVRGTDFHGGPESVNLSVIGWKPFRLTCPDHASLDADVVPPTLVGRFEFFLDRLSLHAGQEVRWLIPEADLAQMRALFH